MIQDEIHRFRVCGPRPKKKVDDHCKIALQKLLRQPNPGTFHNTMSLKLPQSSGLFKVPLTPIASPSYDFQDGYKSLQGTEEGNFPQDFFSFACKN